MNTTALEKFKQYFSELNLQDSSLLEHIYAEDIFFKDPIHEIQGLSQLKSYFQKLNTNLIQGHFEFGQECVQGDVVFVTWEMNLQLKRSKKQVQASGVSVLTIHDKVVQQRDYFDAGELFYEHVPILGSIIGLLKRQIAK